MAKEVIPEEISAIKAVQPHRTQFRQLLVVNPNFFGTAPDSGLAEVVKKLDDTTYEVLRCVSYSPERDRLEATVDLRRPLGYSGGLCTHGSYEHVRFYVSYDDGISWVDAGVASVNVHDLPAAKDCHEQTVFPISYVAGLGFTPKRDRCRKPVLPLVRAILSWEDVPPPNQPDWHPVWGNMRQCHSYVKPRPFVFSDVAVNLPKEILEEIPDYVLEQPPIPIPDPGPLKALSLKDVHNMYAGSDVPAHRFALPFVGKALTPRSIALANLTPQLDLSKLGIDVSSIIDVIAKPGAGDTSYEELFCVGLDNNTDQLAAAFQVKKTSGYLGLPCTAGSIEYVAFWADFGDTCMYEYLGTVQVRAHDFAELPDGGLCFAAVLPVDLSRYRRDCNSPAFGRIRAVLSWGTPPSTTDPDDVPHWGNRVDAHVQLRPGKPLDGSAFFTHLGGVDVDELNAVSGLTLATAHMAANGVPVGAGCPFSGIVTVRGVLDPALVNQKYRILARNVTQNGSAMPLMNSFYVTPVVGPGHYVTPAAGGWAFWPSYTANTDGVLGSFFPGGNDLWELQLELAVGIVDVRYVQMDHLLRNTIDLGDPANAGDLKLFTQGQCRQPRNQPLNGRFVARDEHFLSWSIGVLGGPSNIVPPTPLQVLITNTTQTSINGELFTLDLSGLEPCGYVVRLTISDKAIVDSAGQYHSIAIDRGICLE